MIALLRGAYTTLQETCGSTNSLCADFRNTSSTQSFVDNVRAIELANPFGIRTRVFDDNGDGLAGYNIYTLAFGASGIYESVRAVYVINLILKYSSIYKIKYLPLTVFVFPALGMLALSFISKRH